MDYSTPIITISVILIVIWIASVITCFTVFGLLNSLKSKDPKIEKLKTASIVSILISILAAICLVTLVVGLILLRMNSTSVTKKDESGNPISVSSHTTAYLGIGIVVSILSILAGACQLIIFCFIMFKVRETALYKAENGTTKKVMVASLVNVVTSCLTLAGPFISAIVIIFWWVRNNKLIESAGADDAADTSGTFADGRQEAENTY